MTSTSFMSVCSLGKDWKRGGSSALPTRLVHRRKRVRIPLEEAVKLKA